MWKRIVRRVPSRSAEQASKAARTARDQLADAARSVQAVEFRFTPPAAGWLQMTIAADGREVADWWVSKAADPFSMDAAGAGSEYHRSFVPWLEEVARDRLSVLVVDLEGPLAAIAAAPADAAGQVRLALSLSSVGASGTCLVMDQRQLVSAFYGQLIAFWEGDILNAHWHEWSSRPRWLLRSPSIEAFLSATP